MSKIYLHDIGVEDLFEWFFQYVGSSGGDGAACICCGNPSEAADLFVQWAKGKTGREQFRHPRDEYENGGTKFINFHDLNENFIFCDKDIELGHGDYSFVVSADCRLKRWDRAREGVIKAVVL